MNWISVEEKLPELRQRVLVYKTFPEDVIFMCVAKPLNGCPYEVAEYGYYGKGFFYRDRYPLKYVTHWMPLPDSPNVSCLEDKQPQ